MPFGWQTRDRLTPMRMVPIDHDYPRYEIDQLRRRDRLPRQRHSSWPSALRAATKIEDYRDSMQRYPRADDGFNVPKRPKKIIVRG